MNDKPINKNEIVKSWLESAERNYNTMCHLVDSKDYSWALFLGHLVIEKTLKALYVKKLGQHAIFTHDLLRLASRIGIKMTEEQIEWLDMITTFNLNARYDNYKQDFYKLCTEDFAEVWILRIKNLRQWLTNQF